MVAYLDGPQPGTFRVVHDNGLVEIVDGNGNVIGYETADGQPAGNPYSAGPVQAPPAAQGAPATAPQQAPQAPQQPLASLPPAPASVPQAPGSILGIAPGNPFAASPAPDQSAGNPYLAQTPSPAVFSTPPPSMPHLSMPHLPGGLPSSVYAAMHKAESGGSSPAPAPSRPTIRTDNASAGGWGARADTGAYAPHGGFPQGPDSPLNGLNPRGALAKTSVPNISGQSASAGGGSGGGTAGIISAMRGKIMGRVGGMLGGSSSGSSSSYHPFHPGMPPKPYIASFQTPAQYKMVGFSRTMPWQQALSFVGHPSGVLPMVAPSLPTASPAYQRLAGLPAAELATMGYGASGHILRDPAITTAQRQMTVAQKEFASGKAMAQYGLHSAQGSYQASKRNAALYPGGSHPSSVGVRSAQRSLNNLSHYGIDSSRYYLQQALHQPRDPGPSQTVNNLAKMYNDLANHDTGFVYGTLTNNLATAGKQTPLGNTFYRQPAGQAADTFTKFTDALYQATLDPRTAAARSAYTGAMADRYMAQTAGQKPWRAVPINQWMAQQGVFR